MLMDGDQSGPNARILNWRRHITATEVNSEFTRTTEAYLSYEHSRKVVRSCTPLHKNQHTAVHVPVPWNQVVFNFYRACDFKFGTLPYRTGINANTLHFLAGWHQNAPYQIFTAHSYLSVSPLK